MNLTAGKLSLPIAFVLLSGCRKPSESTPGNQDPPPAPSNRIAVPESVRRNLGIQFVKVERRRVAATLRMPGHFELLPAARREYRTPLAGRVEVVVPPLHQVKAGELLFRLDSPPWRMQQRELGEITTTLSVSRSKIEYIKPLVEAHRAHEASLEEAAKVMTARVQQLEATRASVGGQAAEISALQVQLAQMRADQAEAREKRAESEATVAELAANLAAAEDRLKLALAGAATVLGVKPEVLLEPRTENGSSQPAWRSISAIEFRAAADGIVDALPVATGGWVEVGGLVATVVDVRLVRFRALGLQSDLGRLKPALPARVVAPWGDAGVGDRIEGTLAIGVNADPQQRTVELFLQPVSAPDWARPGVSAYLEVEAASSAAAELAVPLSAVLPDGLQRVLFRRDPQDPDQVIRIEADLGVDDGHWVEVKSGLKDQDEVVLAGAYELMLASSGQTSKAGHFHSDGTFHSGEEKK